MLKLTRFLILIAVALVAARPVMACCLTGHGELAIQDVQAEAPPCHGETLSPQHAARQDHQPSSPMACPGCLDCDASLMQAQSVDDSALLTQPPSETPLAVIASRFDGFEHQSIVLKTGPPGDPLSLHETPLTLKQRLLI